MSNMTPEQRQAMQQRMRERLNNMTPEQQQQLERFRNMSDEMRQNGSGGFPGFGGRGNRANGNNNDNSSDRGETPQP